MQALIAVHNCGHVPASSLEEITMSPMVAFVVAVAGASLVCHVLMTRLQNRRGSRRSSSDSAGSDGTYAGGGGWSDPNGCAGGPFRVPTVRAILSIAGEPISREVTVVAEEEAATAVEE